jgi:hypothetical protein
MPKLPTPEETSEVILDAIKDMKVRAGETAPLMGIQQRLGPSYRAEDINVALQHMQEQGLIEPARPGFVTLTQAGYGQEPSTEEISRAVLDEIGRYQIRPGEAVPVQAIAPQLMMNGLKGDEIGDAIDALVAEGLLELRNGTAFLTESGFEAI